ncbi:MAG TPA: sugar phosphate isomerase/epimerase family protein [Chloroflexota bacterium]|jgi:sugar phosphate isomerase/epimerase|nr:sugar phosphate isomerase/epimerase family protein [Chloroflexota bacterium]
MSWTLGLNTASLAGYGLEEALRAAAGLGFRAVELLAFEGASHSQGDLCGVWFNDLDTAGRDRLLRLLEPFPRRSLHAPFVDAPLLTYNKRTRQCAVEQLQETIDLAAFIGAEAIATHANQRNAQPLEAFWDEMVDVFRRLGDYALERGRGVKLGVETGYPPGAADFARLVLVVDHPAIGATVDVGHVRSCVPRERWGTPEGAAELNDHLAYLLETLGEKVVHFHIHDVRRADFRDHRALGDLAANGVIDFPRLVPLVRRLSYGGLWILELEEPDKEEALRRSLGYLTSLDAGLVRVPGRLG